MRRYFLLLLVAVLQGCGGSNSSVLQTRHAETPGEHKIDKLLWLAGRWEHADKNMLTVELWEQVNDSTLSGLGYSLKGSDTVFKEYLRLEQKNGEIYYLPAVADQNNGAPVSFTLISDTSDIYVFENKAHDFPQRIVYDHVEEDSIAAYIEGMQQGKMRREFFPMKRK